MISGGLLQLTGIFDNILSIISSLVMLLLSLWLTYEIIHFYYSRHKSEPRTKQQINRLLLWLLVVFILSLLIENVGVHTGLIFGQYSYGDVLWPFVINVPAVIGFAWINTLIPSMILGAVLTKNKILHNHSIVALLTGSLMVIFDMVLEPAAMKLNFWNWVGDTVPLQNYMAWFVLGGVFAYLGSRLKVFSEGYPKHIYHAYFSQLIYFFLILFK
jgi:putative membrane protein